MLAMTSNGAIAHLNGPVVVFVGKIGGFAETGHRLNANSIAFDKLVAVTFFAVVCNFWRAVHFGVNTMAYIV